MNEESYLNFRNMNEIIMKYEMNIYYEEIIIT